VLFFLTEHHTIKAYGGSGGIVPRILDFVEIIFKIPVPTSQKTHFISVTNIGHLMIF